MIEVQYFGKVTVVGCSGVGKTCLCNKFIGQDIENVQSTLAAAFIRYNRIIGNSKIQVDVWDTVSNEIYLSYMETFYSGSCISLLVYDITDRDSFNKLNYWAKIVLERVPKDLSIFIIGNKIDLVNERKVSVKEGENYARKLNYSFFETSAVTGNNIPKILDEIANRIYKIARREINIDINSPVYLSVLGKTSIQTNPNESKKGKKKQDWYKNCLML